MRYEKINIYRGMYLGAVGDIRIVTGILDDKTGGAGSVSRLAVETGIVAGLPIGSMIST